MAQAIHSYINSTTAPVDLFEILRYTNLENLKAFAHEQVDKLKELELRTAYHSGLPIGTVLPDDVMQHILSFEEFYAKIENRIISRKWNRLYQKNEENMLRTLYRSITEKYPEPLTPANDTWIWHEVRRQLHPVEQGLGFRGPLYGLDEVHKKCKSGDRVLVHRDVFQNNGYNDYQWEIFTKNIHFIGLLPVELGQCSICLDTNLFGYLRLENLEIFVGAELYVGTDDAEKQSIVGARTLTMKNCDIQCKDPIMVDHLGNLNMRHCRVRSGRPRKWLAIEISPWAGNVNIRDNTIRDFERGIAIQRYNADPRAFGLAEISIEYNVFEDISEYAVVERTDNRRLQSIKIKGTDRCRLRGNEGAPKLPDPNTLFHINEEYMEW